MTSGGGSHDGLVDGPYSILKETDKALHHFKKVAHKYLSEEYEIHMPQINAGIFRVPWEMTEEVLNMHSDLKFNVWIYEG